MHPCNQCITLVTYDDAAIHSPFPSSISPSLLLSFASIPPPHSTSYSLPPHTCTLYSFVSFSTLSHSNILLTLLSLSTWLVTVTLRERERCTPSTFGLLYYSSSHESYFTLQWHCAFPERLSGTQISRWKKKEATDLNAHQYFARDQMLPAFVLSPSPTLREGRSNYVWRTCVPPAELNISNNDKCDAKWFYAPLSSHSSTLPLSASPTLSHHLAHHQIDFARDTRTRESSDQQMTSQLSQFNKLLSILLSAQCTMHTHTHTHRHTQQHIQADKVNEKDVLIIKIDREKGRNDEVTLWWINCLYLLRTAPPQQRSPYNRLLFQQQWQFFSLSLSSADVKRLPVCDHWSRLKLPMQVHVNIFAF